MKIKQYRLTKYLERIADDLTKYLRQDGWPALAIHGDKQQQERDWVLSEFKSGRSPIVSIMNYISNLSNVVPPDACY